MVHCILKEDFGRLISWKFKFSFLQLFNLAYLKFIYSESGS